MKGQGKRFFRGLARELEKKGDAEIGGEARMEGRTIVPRGVQPGASPGYALGHLRVTAHGLRNSTAAPPRIEGFPTGEAMMSNVPINTPASYEAALEELDQLVGLIESGQLPLEQLLTGYQRGAQLLEFCRDKLQAVENQIKVLDEGTLKPWTQ
jgi:exodeoxyribonuclease VII small subunit